MSPDLQTALYGACAVGVLSILAGVIRQAMWNHNDAKMARTESRLAFLRVQISELYSPLLGYLHETATYCDTLNKVIDQIILTAPLDTSKDSTAAIIERFESDHFEPLRSHITELLLSKRHLVVEDRFPPYLQELIAHATEWEASRTVQRELGLQSTSADGYCTRLQEQVILEVEQTLLDLRTEYRSHLRWAGKLR